MDLEKSIKQGLKNGSNRLIDFRDKNLCEGYSCQENQYQYEITNQNGVAQACGFKRIYKSGRIEQVDNYFDENSDLKLLHIKRYQSDEDISNYLNTPAINDSIWDAFINSGSDSFYYFGFEGENIWNVVASEGVFWSFRQPSKSIGQYSKLLNRKNTTICGMNWGRSKKPLEKYTKCSYKKGGSKSKQQSNDYYFDRSGRLRLYLTTKQALGLVSEGLIEKNYFLGPDSSTKVTISTTQYGRILGLKTTNLNQVPESIMNYELCNANWGKTQKPMAKYTNCHEIYTGRITPENWYCHKEIDDIRKMINQIKSHEENGPFTKKEFESDECKGDHYSNAFIVKDKNNITRACGWDDTMMPICLEKGESPGQAESGPTFSYELYFDENGTLRYYKDESYVNAHYYYNKKGQGIWYDLSGRIADVENERGVPSQDKKFPKPTCKP